MKQDSLQKLTVAHNPKPTSNQLGIKGSENLRQRARYFLLQLKKIENDNHVSVYLV